MSCRWHWEPQKTRRKKRKKHQDKSVFFCVLICAFCGLATNMRPNRYKREISAALAFAGLLVAAGSIAPAFFSSGNLRDLAMNNCSVLIVAVGMTLVILAEQIDI